MAPKYYVLNLPEKCVYYLEVLEAIQCKRFLCRSLSVCVCVCGVCVYVCVRRYMHSTYVHVQYIRTRTVHTYTYSIILVEGPNGEV